MRPGWFLMFVLALLHIFRWTSSFYFIPIWFHSRSELDLSQLYGIDKGTKRMGEKQYSLWIGFRLMLSEVISWARCYAEQWRNSEKSKSNLTLTQGSYITLNCLPSPIIRTSFSVLWLIGQLWLHLHAVLGALSSLNLPPQKLHI